MVDSRLEEIGPVEKSCPEMFEDVEVWFDVVVEEGERVIHVIVLSPLYRFNLLRL